MTWLLTARIIDSKEVSEAHCMSRNAPGAVSWFSSDFSICNTNWRSTDSHDLPDWYACWFRHSGLSVRQVSLKCFSSSFSITFSKKGDRLIGLHAFGSAYEFCPGFGTKTTLTRFQTAGTYPIARLALYSLPILVCLFFPAVGEQEISHQDQEIYRHQMNWLPYWSYYS
jgi:hypothetical protein